MALVATAWAFPGSARLSGSVLGAVDSSTEAWAALDTPVGLCSGFETVDGVGPTCLDPSGLQAVMSPDGRFLGLSHGADDESTVGSEPGSGSSPATAAAPFCVEEVSAPHYFQALHAKAIDDTNSTGSLNASQVRQLIGQANGFLHSEAARFGADINLRFRCVDGLVDVPSLTLPTRLADTTFSTIVADVQALGYSREDVHYYIWFDNRLSTTTLGGQAMISPDARLAGDNENLGQAHAAVYGLTRATLTLHEIAHTLGAVQYYAPEANGRGHCDDGRDVMCYADHSGSDYRTTACAAERFDCGGDTYYNPEPEPDSWLETHWNLASRFNFYLDFGRDTGHAVDDVSVYTLDGTSRLIPVLANDFGLTPDATVVNVTKPRLGNATVDRAGVWYAGPVDADANDRFNYTVRSGDADYVGQVVVRPNHSPMAEPKSFLMAEGMSKRKITMGAVDEDGDWICILWDAPGNGTLSNPTRAHEGGRTVVTLEYAPPTGFNGTDHVRFRALDTDDRTCTNTYSTGPEVDLEVLVGGPNEPPTAGPISAEVPPDGILRGALAGDDREGEELAYAIVVPPANGTLMLEGPEFEYALPPGTCGRDSFTYEVSDEFGRSPPGLVTLTVSCPNRRPAAAAEELRVSAGGSLSFTPNGSDPDDEAVSFHLTGAPHRGTINVSSVPWVYQSPTGTSGADWFTYVARDAQGAESPPATVTVTVEPPPSPTASPASVEPSPPPTSSPTSEPSAPAPSASPSPTPSEPLMEVTEGPSPTPSQEPSSAPVQTAAPATSAEDGRTPSPATPEPAAPVVDSGAAASPASDAHSAPSVEALPPAEGPGRVLDGSADASRPSPLPWPGVWWALAIVAVLVLVGRRR